MAFEDGGRTMVRPYKPMNLKLLRTISETIPIRFVSQNIYFTPGFFAQR